MNKSEKITEITKALLAAQKSIEHAIKKTDGVYTKYADFAAVMSAVKSPLNDNGITIIQAVDGNAEGKAFIETMLLHTSGEFISSMTPIYCAKPNDPMAFGSGITYSKRYALQSILGLPTVDDDGEAASKKPIEIPKPTKAEQKAIDAIVVKLQEDADGKAVSASKVAAVLYASKGRYPKDMTKVGTIAAYLVSEGRISSLCGTDDPFPYRCNDCNVNIEKPKDGLCPHCGGDDIYDVSVI